MSEHTQPERSDRRYEVWIAYPEGSRCIARNDDIALAVGDMPPGSELYDNHAQDWLGPDDWNERIERRERLGIALMAESYIGGQRARGVAKSHWPQVSAGVRNAHLAKADRLLAALDGEVVGV